MNQVQPQSAPGRASEDEVDLAHYLDVIIGERWTILVVAIFCCLIGIGYAYLSKPVYEADILIQVESPESGIQGLLGDVGDMLSEKTAATAEIEILRSRLVVSQVVDNLRLYVSAQPNYFPLIGSWMARRNDSLSIPGLWGMGGYVWGNERIDVEQLQVPSALQGEPLTVTAMGESAYSIHHPTFSAPYVGKVGVQEKFTLPGGGGDIEIKVATLNANAGAEFTVTANSRLQVIERLQANLTIAEKGKQSGVLGVTLQGTDPVLTSAILSEIGRQYVKQNVERKSAEAENSLEFLSSQLPEIKRQLEQAEDRYNAMRNRNATIDLGEEARLLLQQSVAGQTTLFELRQKRQELLTRFTPAHPGVKALDRQITAVAQELDKLGASIKGLPNLEQEVVRLTRDVKVNTDLYATLLSNEQQLKLLKAGRIGSVRLVDDAVLPELPVKPQKPLIIGISLVLGMLAGIGAAFAKNALFGGIADAHDIEQHTHLSVFASVPYSEYQARLSTVVSSSPLQGIKLLAAHSPHDLAIESLRSLRTALQFAMSEAKNNIVLLTGPTPGVGKSFVSSNFAGVIASAGKRVLLIDGDLRKGYLHKYFGINQSNGFSEMLAGTLSPEQGITRNIVDGLDFISTGDYPPNPAELMLTPRLSSLLETFSKSYDYVIIDTPPVLAAADTGILAAMVGTMFLVARAEKTTIGEINESVKRLAHAGASVSGAIVNGVSLTRRYGYGGKYGRYRYYAYNYQPEPARRD